MRKSKPLTIFMKDQDRLPPLEIQLYKENGEYYDFKDVVSAKLVVTRIVGGRRFVDMGEMTQVNDNSGGESGKVLLRYEWKENEIRTGDFLMEIVLEYPGGKISTFPKHNYYKLKVLPRL